MAPLKSVGHVSEVIQKGFARRSLEFGERTLMGLVAVAMCVSGLSGLKKSGFGLLIFWMQPVISF